MSLLSHSTCSKRRGLHLPPHAYHFKLLEEVVLLCVLKKVAADAHVVVAGEVTAEEEVEFVSDASFPADITRDAWRALFALGLKLVTVLAEYLLFYFRARIRLFFVSLNELIFDLI